MILRDPVHGLVSFEQEAYQIVPKLLATKELQRLRRIRQLGLTSFAYPGADHTRFSHAIGAAHVMTRLISRLKDIQDQLPKWQRLTDCTVRDAVAAALLHDVGHGPFSHLMEAAVPHGPAHESWSARILLDPRTEVHQVLSEQDPGRPERVVRLIGGEHELTYLAHAVSGTFDVDRCDYLLRDAHFTGVSYGRFDLDWLLRSLRFDLPQDNSQVPSLAVDGAKGLPAIESFIMARLFMFQQVYFHKASRTSEWALTRILDRARQLLLGGSRLTGLPEGAARFLRDGQTDTQDYLKLDDASLWHAIDCWREGNDAILADLCRRLVDRKLFKTFEFFPPEASTEAYDRAHQLARELAGQAGLDPDAYVGLDRARLMPFDENKDSMRVLFPDGSSHAPSEVSFMLGRLRGEELIRSRLIVPPEIRPRLRELIAAERLGANHSALS